jgi:hypothetical protein
MTQASYVYRTFLPEVVSNTHDFDVRWVVHNGRRMRGVFARRSISTPECSLYMGAYPGYRRKKEESALKVAGYVAEHDVDHLTAVRKTIAYTLSLRDRDPGYVLDPTDEKGELLPEFIPYLVCYINEPPPGFTSKAAFVYNMPRQRYEVWLLQAVNQDEEVYLYYGKHYVRDYPVNPGASDDRYSHFIPTESVFRLDQRGIPAPLQVPEEVQLPIGEERLEKER